MSDDDRVAVLERRVSFLNGQVQALAALLALRVGSHRIADDAGSDAGQAYGAWELLVGLHQLEGLRGIVADNREPSLSAGLEGVLSLLEVSVQEALGRTVPD